jgi:hypothetical protein
MELLQNQHTVHLCGSGPGASYKLLGTSKYPAKIKASANSELATLCVSLLCEVDGRHLIGDVFWEHKIVWPHPLAGTLYLST